MEDNYTQFTMRMEKSLYDDLKKSAIKNKRSIAKELEYITELHLREGFQITLPGEIGQKFIDFLQYSPELKAAMRKIEENCADSRNSD